MEEKEEDEKGNGKVEEKVDEKEKEVNGFPYIPPLLPNDE